MLKPEEKINLTGKILTLGKALAPDRFPQPSREVGAAWAKALDRLMDTMPPEMWEEAVTVWAMEMVGEKMITPRNLKEAIYVVRDRWEGHPVKKKRLEQVRRQNEEARELAWRENRLLELKGYADPGAGRRLEAVQEQRRGEAM